MEFWHLVVQGASSGVVGLHMVMRRGWLLGIGWVGSEGVLVVCKRESYLGFWVRV